MLLGDGDTTPPLGDGGAPPVPSGVGVMVVVVVVVDTAAALIFASFVRLLGFVALYSAAALFLVFASFGDERIQYASISERDNTTTRVTAASGGREAGRKE